MKGTVLVVGGGIAGIQTALDLGDQGFKVYIVERTPSIGGRMAQLDKTFPTMDCSACILTPKMVDAARHPNIKLLTYSEVKEVTGEPGRFRVKILKKARGVDEEKCTGCGRCAEYCPVELPNEFDMNLGVRKAIYVPFPQAVPLVYTIDSENCIKCELCSEMCEAGAVVKDQQPSEVVLDVDAIVLATGFDSFEAKLEREYGYGVFDNVINGLEVERLNNASGPTGGHLIRPSDGRIPRRIAFVQCVGSRDERLQNPYCSRVCCMYAVKNAVLIKEHLPEVEITIYYMDLRAFGKGFEEFYKRAEEEYGVKFVRGRVSSIVEDPATKNLTIEAWDTISGKPFKQEVDLAVLSTGLMPSGGSSELAKMLGLELDETGFVKELNLKFAPVETSVKGVFLAGVSQGPKDIPDSVAQASAAASRAAVFVASGKGGR